MEDIVSTQPDHDTELIPRPARTPEALRAALAAIAPERLPEMDADQRRAVAAAIEQSSIKPLQLFMIAWAANIEIEPPSNPSPGNVTLSAVWCCASTYKSGK